MNEILSCKPLPKTRYLAVMGLMMAAWSLPSVADTSVFNTIGTLSLANSGSGLGMSAPHSAEAASHAVSNPASGFDMNTYHFDLSSLAPSYTATLSNTGLFGADLIGMSVLSPTMKLMGSLTGTGSFNFMPSELGTYTLVVAGKPSAPANFDVYAADVAAVPEVGSWAMLLVGLGLVGFQLRRRERTDRQRVVPGTPYSGKGASWPGGRLFMPENVAGEG